MLIFALGLSVGFYFGAVSVYSAFKDKIKDADSLVKQARNDGVMAAVRSMGGVSFCSKNSNDSNNGAPQPLPVFAMKCNDCPNDGGCPVVFDVTANKNSL